MPVLPGTEYEIRIWPFYSDYTLGDFAAVECCVEPYVTGPGKVWCMPEYWYCDRHGCSEVRVQP